MEHRIAEVNTSRRQRRAREVVTSKQTRRILRVRQRQVEEDTLHDEEDTNCSNPNADTAHNPVHIFACRPAEDEQADGHEEGHHERGNETAFGSAEAVGDDGWVDGVVDVKPVARDGEGNGDDYGEEGEAHLAEIEVVYIDIDERECFEEREEDAVGDGCVYGRKGDAGVEKHEFEGAPKCFGCDGTGCQVGLVDLTLCFEVGVAGELAKTLCAAEQDVCGRGLGEKEEEREEDGAIEPEHLPERPAPIHGSDAKLRDNGSKSWSASSSKGP